MFVWENCGETVCFMQIQASFLGINWCMKNRLTGNHSTSVTNCNFPISLLKTGWKWPSLLHILPHIKIRVTECVFPSALDWIKGGGRSTEGLAGQRAVLLDWLVWGVDCFAIALQLSSSRRRNSKIQPYLGISSDDSNDQIILTRVNDGGQPFKRALNLRI